MKAGTRRSARIAAGVALLAGALAVLRPWTVRPIESAKPGVFDAGAYAADAWPRLVAEAERSAVEVGAARLAAAGSGPVPSRRPVFVHATGTVAGIDRRSRVGLAYLTTPGSPSLVRVAMQVGPVIRGTALRDAAGFIRFTDFANQSEFAAVANALNDQALARVFSGLAIESLEGRTLTVIGAATLPAGADDAPVDLVPVKLLVDGGAR